MKIRPYAVSHQCPGDFTLPSPLILPLESRACPVWQGANI